jgi:hypothetical protein
MKDQSNVYRTAAAFNTAQSQTATYPSANKLGSIKKLLPN